MCVADNAERSVGVQEDEGDGAGAVQAGVKAVGSEKSYSQNGGIML